MVATPRGPRIARGRHCLRGHIGGGGGALRRALRALWRGHGGGPERPAAASDLPPRGRQRHQLARRLHAREHRRPLARFVGRLSLLNPTPAALSTTSRRRRLFEEFIVILGVVSIWRAGPPAPAPAMPKIPPNKRAPSACPYYVALKTLGWRNENPMFGEHVRVCFKRGLCR